MDGDQEALYFDTTAFLTFPVLTLNKYKLIQSPEPHPHKEVSVFQIMPGPHQTRLLAQGHTGGDGQSQHSTPGTRTPAWERGLPMRAASPSAPF